jgi:hypothetical protein
MTTTRMALREQVRRNISSRDDLDEVINSGIDHACEELSSHEWPELLARDATVALVASTQYITPASDVGVIHSVQIQDSSSSYNVPLLTRAEAERRYPLADLSSGASPAAAFREGARLYFVPMPNEALTVRLLYDAALSIGADDDDTVSVAGFDSLIVAYATAEAFESIEHGKESADRWWRITQRRLDAKLRRKGHEHVLEGVDLRMGDPQLVDPRIRNPEIVWWEDR